MTTSEGGDGAKAPGAAAQPALVVADPAMARAKISVSPVALAILAIWLGAGAALALASHPPAILTFVFVMAGWLLALTAHEFGHAWVAYRGGDHTVAEKVYLTLNPLRYADLVNGLLLPILVLAVGGIGFPGGAVYLRQDLMRGPAWRSAASLAGPAGTVVVFLALALLQAVLRAMGMGQGPLSAAMAFLAFLQATALFLNLLPVPGLDGYGAIRPFLPESLRSGLRVFERLAFIVVIALVFWMPVAGALLFGGAATLCHLAGISPSSIVTGLRAFQFWR